MNKVKRRGLLGGTGRGKPRLWFRFNLAVGVAVVCLLLAAWAAAKVSVTEFSGDGTLIGLDPTAAEVKCFSGTPTGAYPPCSSGKARIRGLRLISLQTATDPRVGGVRTTVFNANLDAEGSGPVWGTWKLESPGGDFEGTYTGALGGYAVGGHVRVVGHGSEGLVEGLQVRALDAIDPLFNEEITGFLLDAGKE